MAVPLIFRECPVWEVVFLGPKTMNSKIMQAFGTVGFPAGEAAGVEISSEVSEFSQVNQEKEFSGSF